MSCLKRGDLGAFNASSAGQAEIWKKSAFYLGTSVTRRLDRTCNTLQMDGNVRTSGVTPCRHVAVPLVLPRDATLPSTCNHAAAASVVQLRAGKQSPAHLSRPSHAACRRLPFVAAARLCPAPDRPHRHPVGDSLPGAATSPPPPFRSIGARTFSWIVATAIPSATLCSARVP